ncbi:cytochrome b/b6 domain-containing protein, partial [Promineifilum sp.]|uniref:cytochrome b/b6 domain-containing protein n=1 Tax=Promineifilum sp. TaxID=2664178 RepID=UPI0035AF4073
EWLPYAERHTAAVACEACHVPTLYAPALQSIDWTVLDAAGQPVRAYRGLEGDALAPATLITGYQPVLLPRANPDGTTTLAPFNLISSWYWVYGDPARPVPLRDLQAAYFSDPAQGEYAGEILASFDGDGDGQLSTPELNIITDAQVAAVRDRLAARGLDNPRIAGEVEPYGIHHNVADGEWATRECRACHGSDSKLAAPIELSGRTPGGVEPTLAENGLVSWPGAIEAGEGGTLHFAPDTGEAGLYVLGHNAVRLIDWLGALMVLGVSAGVVVHGGLRFFAARRRAKEAGEPGAPAGTHQVYMYDVYERLWHWLQTAAILLLLFTGLIIHKPDMFGIFSFAYVVQVHNILALLLVINAALSLFYHLASGQIRQFIPRPRGFFDQAAQQAIYYLRGIFRNEPHPFEKTRERKMNPLQQVTYVMVLNVLLPLQIITGALMWGAQRWPAAAGALGGLPFLGPLHSLVAWTFAAFIILHVYLTTTGPTPAAGIKAMMLGYEAVEAHEAQPMAGTTD